MSNYTTQLRFICEAYAGKDSSAPSSDVDSVINLARPKIFDFYYPIFDENYRAELENKILQHYYTQEIGLETVGLWKLKLRTKMREIMPYYNQLYKSELLKFDPFINTDYTDERETVGTETNVTAGTSHGEATGDSLTVSTATDTAEHIEEKEGDFLESRTRTADSVANTDNVSQKGTDHTGRDVVEFEPISNRNTLTKHSDTPLGAVDGVTAVGDNSNYLSDVTMVVDNYNGDHKQDETRTIYNSGTSESASATTGNTATEQSAEANTNTHHDTGTANDNSTRVETTTGTTHNIEDGSTETTSNGTNASDYAGRIFGKTGAETYSEMLNKFRDTFLNIDMDVINELNNLFMLVW